MYSDFVEEYNGFLRLMDEEYEEAREIDQGFPRAARQLVRHTRDIGMLGL